MYNFENEFNKIVDQYIQVSLSPEDIRQIEEIVGVVVPAKESEYHHQIDGCNEYKRFTTGYYGERAVEKLLGINFIRYSSGHSNNYHNADIGELQIGVKTVEYGKFPIIFKKNKEPQIICVKMDNCNVYVCGLATTKVLNTYQSDSLILSPKLKARGTKTGFYGFRYLLPFKNMEELKELLKQGD